MRRGRLIAVGAVLTLVAAVVVASARDRSSGAVRNGGCDRTDSSAGAAAADVSGLPGGSVVCLRAGTYAGLELSRRRGGTVRLRPASHARVTIGAGAIDSHHQRVAVVFDPGASRIVLHGFYITDEVELEPGDSGIRIDHNDISGGWFGIQLDSSDCTVPNAPRWAGCHPLARITRTVISGNRIHGIVAKDDALNIDNYAGLRITRNEIFDVVEGGHHTDCLQSTFGGTDLLFDHNYEHDNECQGFFLKDGDVRNVTFTDNLFLRDTVPALNGGSSYSSSQVYNTWHLVVRRNTIWDNKGLTLRCVGAQLGCTGVVDHNVLSSFTVGNRGDLQFYRLNESYNLFGSRPWSFRTAHTDRASLLRFHSRAKDDYRLVHNPHHIGIDWWPGQEHYGP